MNKIIPKWHGSVSKGRLVLRDKDKFNMYLSTLEGEVLVVIKKPTKNEIRSINQNKYYWKVVVGIFCETTGYDKDEAHEILMLKILGEEISIKKDTFRIVKKRTSQLNTKEMEDYLLKCRMFISIEFGEYIPLPNEIGGY